MARADVEACYNHYASQGWVKGNGQRITSLHALLAKWKANGANHGNAHGQGGNGRKRSGPIVPDYGDENDPLIGDAVRKMREETTVK